MVQFECPRHWKPTASSNFEIGRIPFSAYWSSGVIRIGSPVWKCKSWKLFRTNVAQQAANGLVWMPQALKAHCIIQFWDWKNSLFCILALWGNKNWPPQYESEEVGNFSWQKWLKGLQMVQFECPRHWNSSILYYNLVWINLTSQFKGSVFYK